MGLKKCQVGLESSVGDTSLWACLDSWRL